MVPWKGRLIFKQYLKKKSHKYGVKFYKLCTPRGFVLDFMIYTGKGSTEAGKSHAESVVDYLMKDYYEKGHNLFCDN